MHEDRSKEIIGYLTTLVRELGDFRKGVDEFRREVGDFRQETETRLDTLELSVKVLVSDVGELKRHAEVLDARMERFEGALDDVRRSVRLLNHKFAFVSEEIGELRSDDRGLRKRVEAVEKKVGTSGDV